MKIKKTKKQNKRIFLKVLTLASIWVFVILMFAVVTFNYGVKQATSFNVIKIANEIKTTPKSKEVADSPKVRQSIHFRESLDRIEKYIRNNLVSIAEANNAGDDKTVAEDINFIGENRALVSYRSDGEDRYLAEVVFEEDNGQVKIDRFILKIKNDTDYSEGVYGAD